MTERIPIASDHAGYELKERLRAALVEAGFDVSDIGTHGTASTDYADYAHPLAQQVSDGEVRRGVLLCGTGLGMSYVANRYPGVRAAVAWTPEIAELARKHNDANVLVLPARFLSDEDALAILQRWLDTDFDGGRHERRVAKIERDDERDGERDGERADERDGERDGERADDLGRPRNDQSDDKSAGVRT